MVDKKQKEKVIYVVGDHVSVVNDAIAEGWHIKEMHSCGCHDSGRLYVWLIRDPEEPA